MKRLLALVLMMGLLGCNMPGERIREDKVNTTEETIKKLEGKKVLKVTILDSSHIIVTAEDGTTITFYGYNVRNDGAVVKEPVGAR